MLVPDQPKIFGDAIVVGLSSVEDGNMHFAYGEEEETRENQLNFLRQVGIDPTSATLVQVSYKDTTSFTRYHVVDDENEGEGVLVPESSLYADGLVASRPDQALFLPLADCVGAILYDTVEKVLMVSHLGRHSVEQDGAYESVKFMENEYGCAPANLLIWLSPAVGGESYPLKKFNNRSLHDVISGQLERAGVGLEQIEVSSVDTAEDDNYYSHSEYLAGNQMTDSRFAIIAMMRE